MTGKLRLSEKAVERAMKNANDCELRRSCEKCERFFVCVDIYIRKREEGRL